MKTLLLLLLSTFLFTYSAWGQCNTAPIYANDSTHAVCFDTMGDVRKCYTNNIPDHAYGPFAGMNEIEGQNFEYSMCLYPQLGTVISPLTEDTTSMGCGGGSIFGISMQGVNYSPFARLYFVNTSTMMENLDFHVEADFLLTMDLNGGHVNAVSRYHYHNIATDYFNNDLGIDGTLHSPLLGYAADGFPIYYKYLYTDSMNPGGGISAFQSGYDLIPGTRPGDGISAPNGVYDGNYVEDYEYVPGTSFLDECGGRFGVTPEYPSGTYYYVLTDNWPYIPRCFKGEYPDNSFRIGPMCPSSTAATDCSPLITSNPSIHAELSLSLFPNPTQDIISIGLNNRSSETSIQGIKLYNLEGATLFASDKFESEIDVRTFPAGTYFIQIDAGHRQLTEKIIIQ